MGGNFYKLSMNDVPLRGKTVLVRADYNVPLTKDGEVDDDYRIRMSVPTIQRLLDQGCRIVVVSHLGRPDGKKDERYTLEPAAKRLAELLKQPVRFIDDCVGHKVYMAVKRAPKSSVTVLENLRFYPGEGSK
jgi:phosphoglycerate kinase